MNKEKTALYNFYIFNELENCFLHKRQYPTMNKKYIMTILGYTTVLNWGRKGGIVGVARN